MTSKKRAKQENELIQKIYSKEIRKTIRKVCAQDNSNKSIIQEIPAFNQMKRDFYKQRLKET
jgi:hypothetical protein